MCNFSTFAVFIMKSLGVTCVSGLRSVRCTTQ